MNIPTIIAAETSMDALTFIAALIGSNVLNTVAVYFAMRRKNRSEANKIDAEAIVAIGNAFRDLVKDFNEFSRRALSAEESHSLERIASREKLADLEEQVDKCEKEHLDWAECKTSMLQFLITIEPQLQQITSATTLVDAVVSLRRQIERT